MIASDRHNTGWPRFSLVVQTGSSEQTHRIYVHCQGQIHSHDARGPTWEGVQHRPMRIISCGHEDDDADADVAENAD